MGKAKTTPVVGVAPDVATEHGEQLAALLGRRSTASGIYDRGNGDTAGPLPLSQHTRYAADGWTLVRITHTGGMVPAV